MGPRPLSPAETKTLATLFDGILPLELPTLSFTLADAEWKLDTDGQIVVKLLVSHKDENGVTVEVREDMCAVAALEDLSPSTRDRTRAFFEGWRLGTIERARQLASPDAAEGTAMTLPAFLLDDLALQTVDDFCTMVERADWRDSDPDWYAPRDVEDLSATVPIAMNEDLEQRIREAPDDARHYLAYADWLEPRGDPRAPLIRAQCGTTRTDRRLASLLLRQHAAYFHGELTREPDLSGRERHPWEWNVLFTWHAGFVRHVRLVLPLQKAIPSPLSFLRGIFHLPSAKFLQSLELELDGSAEELEPDERWPLPRWTDALLTAGPHPTLKRLALRRNNVTRLGPPTPLFDREEDVAALLGAFPELREVVVDGDALRWVKAMAGQQ